METEIVSNELSQAHDRIRDLEQKLDAEKSRFAVVGVKSTIKGKIYLHEVGTPRDDRVLISGKEATTIKLATWQELIARKNPIVMEGMLVRDDEVAKLYGYTVPPNVPEVPSYNSYKDDEIDVLLKLKLKDFEKRLENIDSDVVLDRLIERAEKNKKFRDYLELVENRKRFLKYHLYAEFGKMSLSELVAVANEKQIFIPDHFKKEEEKPAVIEILVDHIKDENKL